MKEKRVLIIDDEEGVRHSLGVNLRKAGFAPTSASGANEALAIMDDEAFDVILCDIRMPGMDGIELLREMQKRQILSTVIMMSAYGDSETAIDALRSGAYDYISKPFKKDEVLLTIRKAEERELLRRENKRLQDTVERTYSFSNIISKNARMQELFDAIRRIADYKTTVMITGDSGTGKELVARAIHFNGVRKKFPFVPVNCGAIPGQLLESELFGHVKGAFTDARTDKTGLVEEADGGTLFLDEIGELPQNLQVKLLRVLQDEEIRKVGGTSSIQVDIRILAATSKDLEEELAQGRFREDLFYRLNVFPIQLPSLNERLEDVPLLVDHFIKVFNKRLNSGVEGITKEAMAKLMQYQWPGNIRELENTIERAMVLCSEGMIQPEHLPKKIQQYTGSMVVFEEGDLSIKKNARLLEERMIREALERTEGNRTRAAKLLSISHRALLYKIKEYRIKE